MSPLDRRPLSVRINLSLIDPKRKALLLDDDRRFSPVNIQRNGEFIEDRDVQGTLVAFETVLDPERVVFEKVRSIGDLVQGAFDRSILMQRTTAADQQQGDTIGKIFHKVLFADQRHKCFAIFSVQVTMEKKEDGRSI